MTPLQEQRNGNETNAIETEAVARQKLDVATRDFIGEMCRISRELDEDRLDTQSVLDQTGTVAGLLEQQLRRNLISDATWSRQIGVVV